MRKELLIGCGNNKAKIMGAAKYKEWSNLVTLDINFDCKPDVLWDLTNLPLPFEDDTFDEIHAYEVLEHTGQQGDYKFFFEQFSEFYRIMKPSGLFFGSCPKWNSPWTWGDPGHTRVIQPESFSFLSQAQYKKEVGVTHMTDYRNIYKADFNLVHLSQTEHSNNFALEAIKPSRIDEEKL